MDCMLFAVSYNLLADVLFAVLAIAAVAWFVIWWKRSPLTFKQIILWSINYAIARLMWRTHFEGSLPVNSDRGAVIVANHRSGIDPSLIQPCIRRVVYWMVAREYCENWLLGPILRALQVIPVGRGGIDTAATKYAIRLASEGGLIGMFPEGRVNETDDLLLPGRPGAALVALKARVPIIPIYIIGAPYDGTPLGPLKMRAKVLVKIGHPLDISEYFGREREDGVTQKVTLRAMKEIAKLAGHPDFEPQLAGRRWRNGDTAVEENGNENPAAAPPLASPDSNGQHSPSASQKAASP
jgi:1-acyl-sn-glycerol-3-phosphate acyltransferase